MADDALLLTHTPDGIPLYRFPSLAEIPRFSHAITTARTADGRRLNLSFSGREGREQIVANRKAVCGAIGIDPATLTAGRQVHGSRVVVVRKSDIGRGGLDPASLIPACDAMVTNESPAAMMILCADCAALILWDEEHRAAGVCHCGWRGVLAGVVGNTLSAMREHFGTRPESLLACCTPSIGPCCFEVGGEVAERFVKTFAVKGVVSERGGKFFVDLRAAISIALRGCGVKQENISVSQICTMCSKGEFFSHRAEGEGAGRFGVIAAIV